MISDDLAVFKIDGAIPAGQRFPVQGSFDFIYLRSASSDQIQFSADGQTFSDLPVGIVVPLTGRRANGGRGPRQPILRVKDGTAQTFTAIVSTGISVQDFATIIASGTVIASLPAFAQAKSFTLADVALTFTNNIPLNNLRLALVNNGVKTVRLRRLRYRIPIIGAGAPTSVQVLIGKCTAVTAGTAANVSGLIFSNDGITSTIGYAGLADGGATNFAAGALGTIINAIELAPAAALPTGVDAFLTYQFQSEEFSPTIKPGENFCLSGGNTSAAASFSTRIHLDWTEE